MDLKSHWNNIFTNTENNNLGWWENDFSQTLKFLNTLNINSNTNIFLAGSGTSTC